MRPRTRRLKSLSVGTAWSSGQATGPAPQRRGRWLAKGSIRTDPGVCPPLPHENPGWGRAGEVGRGSSAEVYSGSLARGRQDQVFTLYQAGSVLPSGHVLQPNIVRQRSKEGNALPQKHRNPGNDQPLNQAGPEKTLNGDSPIHVNMADAALFKLANDVLGVARELFHSGASRRRVQGSTAQHVHRLLAVGPDIEAKDRLIRFPADDQRVHRRHEAFVAVFLAATLREPIQATVGSSDEAVEAGADEN